MRAASLTIILAVLLAGCTVRPHSQIAIVKPVPVEQREDANEGYSYVRIVFVNRVPYYVDDHRHAHPVPVHLRSRFAYPHTLRTPPAYGPDTSMRNGYHLSRIIYVNHVPYYVENDRQARPLPTQVRDQFKYGPTPVTGTAGNAQPVPQSGPGYSQPVVPPGHAVGRPGVFPPGLNRDESNHPAHSGGPNGMRPVPPGHADDKGRGRPQDERPPHPGLAPAAQKDRGPSHPVAPQHNGHESMRPAQAHGMPQRQEMGHSPAQAHGNGGGKSPQQSESQGMSAPSEGKGGGKPQQVTGGRQGGPAPQADSKGGGRPQQPLDGRQGASAPEAHGKGGGKPQQQTSANRGSVPQAQGGANAEPQSGESSDSVPASQDDNGNQSAKDKGPSKSNGKDDEGKESKGKK